MLVAARTTFAHVIESSGVEAGDVMEQALSLRT